jgi:hypothetical protein
MKECRGCKKTKSFDEFYPHSQMFDGYLNKCKECVRGAVREHRKNNLDRIRSYDRKRGRTEKRLSLSRERSRKKRVECAKYKKAWIERNSEKRAAHLLVQGAVSRKEIVKGVCEVCGAAKVEAHHDDYTKPLEVRWLCRKHHAEHHRKYKD